MPDVIHQGLRHENAATSPAGHHAEWGLRVFFEGRYYEWSDATRKYERKPEPLRHTHKKSRFEVFAERVKPIERRN